MAEAVLVKTVIFDQRMYANTGLVGKWVTKVTLQFTNQAIAAAPIRSGELKSRINGSTARTGERSFDGAIESAAPHTMYVIGGTTGPIFSRAAWDTGANKKLAVGNRAWPPLTPMMSVSGQRANNFLFTAWRRTAVNHSAIRGKLPGGFPGSVPGRKG